MKKELRDQTRRLNKELRKTYRDLKSIGWGAVGKGRKKLTKKAESALGLIVD